MNRASFSALERVVRAANIECFNSRQLAAVFVYWHEIDLVLIPIWSLNRGFRYKKNNLSNLKASKTLYSPAVTDQNCSRLR